MRTRRRRLAVVTVIGSLVVSLAGAFLAVPGDGSATTGDTYVLPPSRYPVPYAVMRQYYGSYRMSHVEKGAKLFAANIFVTQNDYHDLYGGGSFFGYDSDGQQESWTNILYDFQLLPPAGEPPVQPWTTAEQAADHTLVVALYGWGSASLGSMRLRRSTSGDLVGTIQFRGQQRSYAVTFDRTSDHV